MNSTAHAATIIAAPGKLRRKQLRLDVKRNIAAPLEREFLETRQAAEIASLRHSKRYRSVPLRLLREGVSALLASMNQIDKLGVPYWAGVSPKFFTASSCVEQA
jgi:hypothetical protein